MEAVTVTPLRAVPRRISELIERVAKTNEKPIRATSQFASAGTGGRENWRVSITGKEGIDLQTLIHSSGNVRSLNVRRSGPNVVADAIVTVKP